MALDSGNKDKSLRLALTVATPGALPSAFVVYREPMETVLPKIAGLGYDGVELALLDRSQIDLPQLKRLLGETGLRVPMVSTGQVFAAGNCSFAAADASVRAKAEEMFRGLVGIAAELGAMINVGRVRGAIAGNGTAREVESRVADSLSRLSSFAAEQGVTIALEPVNRYEIDLLNSCQDAAAFLTGFGLRDVRLMPDVFHMNIEDRSIEESLERFSDRIGYVHFADSNRHAPGSGHLDFPLFVSTLRKAGYQGWIGVEILPYPDPDTAATLAANHLRSVLGRQK